jgi:hypothetical protein
MSILTRPRRAVKPSRVSRAASRPFGEGLDAFTTRYAAEDFRPAVEPFAPSLEDRSEAETILRDAFEPTVDRAFWFRLEATARTFRGRNDAVGRFVADELERIIQTARLIDATGPDDFGTLRDLADMTARGAWESRGFEAGYAEGLVDATPFDGRLD